MSIISFISGYFYQLLFLLIIVHIFLLFAFLVIFDRIMNILGFAFWGAEIFGVPLKSVGLSSGRQLSYLESVCSFQGCYQAFGGHVWGSLQSKANNLSQLIRWYFPVLCIYCKFCPFG